MSGLIWAGIGKGIADAGSTFGNYMAKDIESRMQSEREAQREERLLARQEALDRIKADREEAKAEALKTRVATEAVQVEERAAQAPMRRDAAALGRDSQTLAKSSAQAGEDGDFALSEDQLKGLMQSDPKLRESYAKSGIIGGAIADKMDPRLRAADDQSTAALELGAHSSVIDAYAKKRKDVLDQIRLENTEKKNDQQFAATMAAITQRRDASEAKLPIAQQQADAATTRAEASVTNANRPRASGGGSGGSASSAPKVRSTKVDDAGNMVAIMSDGSTKNLGIKSSDFNNKVASLVTQMAKNDYQFNKLTEDEKRERAIQRLTGGATAPKSSDNRPSTSGTPTKNYSNLWK
jgi:hypothetical protein